MIGGKGWCLGDACWRDSFGCSDIMVNLFFIIVVEGFSEFIVGRSFKLDKSLVGSKARGA